MKTEEAKELVQSKGVKIRVLQVLVGLDYHREGWLLEFYREGEGAFVEALETASGDIQVFKSLDEIEKFLGEMDVPGFEVFRS